MIAVLALLSILLLLVTSPARAQRPDPRVTRAALGTWIHGINDEIAEREIGEAGVPALIQLLADPTFPRRDNVVAFLALPGRRREPRRRWCSSSQAPPAALTLPEEDRALLLAPQALGQIARRGEPRALEALLEMTENGANGGAPRGGGVARAATGLDARRPARDGAARAARTQRRPARHEPGCRPIAARRGAAGGGGA